MPRREVTALALVSAVIASAWIAWLTRAPGPGLSPDGMSYLGAAQSIARGHEPRVPFTVYSDDDSTTRLRDYPPGFPLAIAAASKAAGSLVQGGRAVLVVSAGLTAGATALLVGVVGGPAAGVAAAIALLATPAFVEAHSIVLSEPPYLAIVAVLLALMTMEQPPALLLGVACAAAVMVRYAGLSAIAAAGLLCLIEPRPMPARLARVALATGPGLIAFLAWNYWAGAARVYGWYPGFLTTLAEGAGTAQALLAPSVPPGVIRAGLSIAVAVALSVAMVRASRRPGIPRVRRLLRACGLVAACFAALMIGSRLFADGAIIFDNRLLSPLILLGTIATFASLGAMWPAWSARGRAVAVLLYACWIAGTLGLTREQVRELGGDGWGYASSDWQSSDLAEWLRDEGRAYALFSDNGPATWSLVKRPSRFVPETTDSASIVGLRHAVRVRPAAIISFTDPYTAENPHGEVFAKRLGFVEAMRSDEGSVWVPPAGP